MTIAERLRNERTRRGWSQADLARNAGVSQATISRIEEGKVRSPRLGVLRKLASALLVTIDSLVEAYQLNLEEALRRDPRVQAIFSGYERLPEEKRTQIADFVRFLEHKELEEGTGLE